MKRRRSLYARPEIIRGAQYAGAPADQRSSAQLTRMPGWTACWQAPGRRGRGGCWCSKVARWWDRHPLGSAPGGCAPRAGGGYHPGCAMAPLRTASRSQNQGGHWIHTVISPLADPSGSSQRCSTAAAAPRR